MLPVMTLVKTLPSRVKATASVAPVTRVRATIRASRSVARAASTAAAGDSDGERIS